MTSDGSGSRYGATRPRFGTRQLLLALTPAAALALFLLLLHRFGPPESTGTHDLWILGFGVLVVFLSGFVAQIRLGRVSERADSAEQARAELQERNARLSAGRLPAQRRAAYALHEVVAQDLSACRSVLSTAPTADPDALTRAIAGVDGVLARSVEDLRRIATTLSPSLGEDLGLASVIDELAESARRDHGVDVRADVDPAWRLLPASAQMQLNDVVADLVTTAVAIPSVTHVDLKLARHGDRLTLAAGYNGRDTGDTPCGRGYLARLGASCTCSIVAGDSTLVELAVPFESVPLGSSES